MKSAALPALLLGFALGAAAGSWGQRAMFHRAMRDGAAHRRKILDKLGRELSLDERQKAEVSGIMESRKADVDKLRADTFARLEAIRKSADAEMAMILTAEQAAKLDAMHHGAKPMRINWEAPPPVPAPPP